MSLQVLRELPEAAQLLDLCVAVIQRAYALYISEDDDEGEPVLRSDDPLLTAASHGDAHLLLYALIRRAAGQIDAPDGALRLYRADEIAEPGQITQQVKAAIGSAHVVIADITHVNPNVMWELGYAHGLGKTIVILNQDLQSSPFDMVDRRQVAYNLSPADKDDQNLTRHLVEALRTGHGLQYQVRTNTSHGRSATLRRRAVSESLATAQEIQLTGSHAKH